MSAPTSREWLRTAADRIAIGSQRLLTRSVGRVARAAKTRVERLPWWVQLGLAFVTLLRGPGVLARLGDWAHERVESGAWSGFLAVSAIVWVMAAYRAGQGEDVPQEPPAADEAEPDEADDAQPAPAVEQRPGPPPVSPTALIAAVRDVGTPHAQLKPLAEHLGTTTDAVRASAAGLGWTVKDVRMQGRSASAGLRWDEVPSPPPLDPSPSVVGAGQAADDNDDDRVRAVLVRDRENPVRTHVVWRDQ
ncbi:hypothetical protein [Streptomyces sp. NPDC005760]|uniref:hypothetical protein n=1 Tax=Streptomyces sp. NPDC005760 TaxID=3156718 RepID=UPI0033C3B960